MPRWLVAFSPAVCFLAAGCSGGPAIAEVEGTVKLAGKGLDKIQVEFWPEREGPRSMGTTDAQGRYVLTVDGTRKGAVVGSHKVVLKDVGVLGDKFLGRAGEDVDMAKGKKARVGGDYEDPAKTKVTKTVSAGKNTIDIDIVP